MGGPRVATVTSPSGRAMQWVEGMQDKHHPTFSQHQLFLLFPSKAWERAKQEHLHHSLLLHSSTGSGFAGIPASHPVRAWE